MDFDLSKYELSDTATLIVQNPGGDGDLLGSDGQPVTITFFGPGSEEFVKAEHKADNAATMRMQSALRGKGIQNQSEQSENALVDKLVAITKSISQNFPVNARDLYGNRKLVYIRNQAVRFITDTGNFTKP